MPAPTDGQKISAETIASALDGTEYGPVVQAGANRRQLNSQLLTYILPSVPLFVPLIYDSPAGSITWASMPQALTEFNNATRTRMKADLTGRTQARALVLCVTGNNSVNTPVLGVQYSLDQSAWNFLDDSAGPVVSVATGGGILVVSNYVTLAANAKADVFLRVIGQGGNGSSGTVIVNMALQVK